MTKMDIKNLTKAFVFLMAATIMASQVNGLMPYTRSLWDMMIPEDPFRILEDTPLTIPKGTSEPVALARADWKETPQFHVIVLDIPGMKREDLKIEVEDNRVLRISGERKEDEQVEGEKWHRAERINGKFWRQFRLPSNADLDHVKAHLEDGVLKITVPKFSDEAKRQSKVIDIDSSGGSGEYVRTTSKTSP
ncbi:22.0 kDa class IV heat shock protein [Hibiscus syriacus]|uniref:22.0 kDa class IV heat shock protein n=1 Tax=Hibiscus syriacus TaxID=106335 RepID=A0A6A3AGN2_HIBSY|nr:22.0 kDa class IV heat shock protein-like [Hibiscus syriacus]KAE8702877.1 22.0 kDa class IV heat shock protein [Hibiscus syriacus]